MPVLSFRDVDVSFRHGRQVVHAVSAVMLSIDDGDTIAVVGESGSGKSTLGQVGIGLLRPDRGSVLTASGIDLATASRRAIRSVRPSLQLVVQNPYQAFSPRLRLSRSLLPAARRFGSGPARDRVVELFAQMGLSENHLDRFPDELSGGQLQRAALARALIVDPALLVADEVMAGVDVASQEGIAELLRSHQRRVGFAMVFITHDLGLARRVADRIIVMEAGRIVERGPIESVLDSPRHPATVRLLDAIPCLPAAENVETAGGRGRLTGGGPHD